MILKVALQLGHNYTRVLATISFCLSHKNILSSTSPIFPIRGFWTLSLTIHFHEFRLQGAQSNPTRGWDCCSFFTVALLLCFTVALLQVCNCATHCCNFYTVSTVIQLNCFNCGNCAYVQLWNFVTGHYCFVALLQCYNCCNFCSVARFKLNQIKLN